MIIRIPGACSVNSSDATWTLLGGWSNKRERLAWGRKGGGGREEESDETRVGGER